MFAGYHYTLNPKKPGYDGLWGTHPEFGLMRGTENIIGTSATQRGKALQSGAYAIDARRLHLLMKWVVSFPILSRFRHHRRGASERERACSRRWRLDETASPRRRRRGRQRF